MKATVKVQQNHSNLMITIPKSIREIVDVKKGEVLLLEVQKNGNILIKK